MKKVFLIKQEGLEASHESLDYINKNCEVVDKPSQADEFVSIGGDGTLLGAVRNYKKYNKPFFGFHFGSDDFSDGFMLNPINAETLSEFGEQKMYTEEIPMLKVEMFDTQGDKLETKYAFGDCYFKDYLGGIIHTKLSINDKVKFESIDSDGVLVCTSAGSTAYNASAKGVILPLDSRDMVVTAICPKPLYRWHSTILSKREVVELEPKNTGRRPAKFWLDGQVVEGVAKVRVSQSDRVVKLCFANSYDFRQKVLNLQFGS